MTNLQTLQQATTDNNLILFKIILAIVWSGKFLLAIKLQVLDSSKLEESADDNFEFDENGTKFSKWLENRVGNGEIARYEQFLLFPNVFKKTCTADT